VLRILRQPALTVAPGAAEAAGAHIRTVAERLRLVNRQIREAHHQLDGLCTKLGQGDTETPPGQEPEQRDDRRYGSCRSRSRCGSASPAAASSSAT
jgi:hypothetical protein